MPSDSTPCRRSRQTPPSREAALPGVMPVIDPSARAMRSCTAGSSTWASPGGPAIARITRWFTASPTRRLSALPAICCTGASSRCSKNSAPMTASAGQGSRWCASRSTSAPLATASAGTSRPASRAHPITATVSPGAIRRYSRSRATDYLRAG